MPRWTFEQIEGPAPDRKTLELDGYNAPFGRPRKGPVFREHVVSRIHTTRYPGSHQQTRHAFGTNWEATEISGRWMTKAMTDGKIARDVAKDWIEFLRDEKTCRIAWGFIVSYTGYLRDLYLDRESEDEIAWKMVFEIDSEDELGTRRAIQTAVAPAADNLAQLQELIADSKELQGPLLRDISPDFLDSLDNLAAELNKPAAELAKLAGRFDDLERGSYTTLQHFRGAVGDMREALVSLRDTVVNATIDSVVLVRTCETDVAWVKYQTDLDAQMYVILDQLNQLDRKAELAASKNQSPTKFVTAVDQDSWEAISIRASGGADKAALIRQINGIRYGERPTVGQSYLVPSR